MYTEFLFMRIYIFMSRFRTEPASNIRTLQAIGRFVATVYIYVYLQKYIWVHTYESIFLCLFINIFSKSYIPVT